MSQELQWKLQSPVVPATTQGVIQQLLTQRAITSEDDQTVFFHSNVLAVLKDLYALFPTESVNTAIAFIQEAITTQKPIFIHGDYDVDGISATAILWEAIYRDIGYKHVHPFIPHRTKHGYGLSRESVDEILQHEAKGLVVTVDCGITAKEVVEYGRSQGLEFIITDHHTIQEEKQPHNVPILHTYDLCGAGIAWVLSLILKKELLELSDAEIEYTAGMDLVALATLSDIQSLTDYNRVLVKEGLPLLTTTRRVGLQKLFEIAGITGRDIGTYEVGWIIGPRLNAMGRLEHALDSLRLLCTTNSERAMEIAKRMDDTNQERQSLTMESIEQAVEMVLQNNWQDDCLLVVSHEMWHEGVLGLIAGKLVERFGVPVIAFGPSDSVYKGSARSVEGFNIVEAIKKQEHLLLESGGHAMAAGLSIEENNIATLRDSLREEANTFFNHTKPPKTISIDMALPVELISVELVTELSVFEPHGIGNPRPTFQTNSLTVVNMKAVGNSGQHLKLELAVNGGTGTFDAIAFNRGELTDNFQLGDKVDVVYNLEINNYFERPRVQLKVKDLRIVNVQ